MIKAFFSVGFWTLLSRLSGFARDLLLAGLLGAGPLMDAFTIAFRLPNHFRAIFAEGAFNTAFLPAYTRLRLQMGEASARLFQGRIFTILLGAQLALLAGVWVWTPGFVRLLAPGFLARGAEAFDLAVALTRITFPYLALVTLVTLWSGVLNAHKKFALAAGAPIVLNAAMITTLLLAPFFPNAAYAAACGVLLAGLLEAGLLFWGVRRLGAFAPLHLPRPDPALATFFRAFFPAVIGAAGTQIAMLADTVLVTLLPSGGASALYYADRLYQLPVGLIGVAAGTVLLPEMTRLLAQDQTTEAQAQQSRTLALTFLLGAPFFMGFMLVSPTLVAGIFERGAFDAAATQASAAVLSAYALGLPAMLATRALVAPFHARSDTRTPMVLSLAAIALNLGLKWLLWQDYGAAGLAFATACGAITNVALLYGVGRGRGFVPSDPCLRFQAFLILTSAVWLGVGLLALDRALIAQTIGATGRVAVLAGCGAVFYGATVFLAFKWARLPLNLRRPVDNSRSTPPEVSS